MQMVWQQWCVHFYPCIAYKASPQLMIDDRFEFSMWQCRHFIATVNFGVQARKSNHYAPAFDLAEVDVFRRAFIKLPRAQTGVVPIVDVFESCFVPDYFSVNKTSSLPILSVSASTVPPIKSHCHSYSDKNVNSIGQMWLLWCLSFKNNFDECQAAE